MSVNRKFVFVYVLKFLKINENVGGFGLRSVRWGRLVDFVIG